MSECRGLDDVRLGISGLLRARKRRFMLGARFSSPFEIAALTARFGLLETRDVSALSILLPPKQLPKRRLRVGGV